ncbi:MAG TPA: nucleotidyl transferase AbiEii/AbiGii toxin family protein [Patescibacteria group bacterium]|nr:nucleotidyl transferase AbiEii/AbiGii toxin family protein [Patescibacteria group bacterium]
MSIELAHPADAMHKMQLYRLLMAILDEPDIARAVRFKGGTCAAMLGWLDRFSIDLDFDCAPDADKAVLRHSLRRLFDSLQLMEKKGGERGNLLFVVGYKAPTGARNSMKVSIVDTQTATNVYHPLYLSDINRYALCQTKDTMVANKLVAPLDRHEHYGTVAGRDIYDIGYFLSHGYPYRKEVIEERRGIPVVQHLEALIDFIRGAVTDRIIAEDLNYLLPAASFRAIRKTLKQEVLVLLSDEINRLNRVNVP